VQFLQYLHLHHLHHLQLQQQKLQQLKGLLWWMRMLGGIKGQELVESVDKRHTSGKVFATIWNV
jgi:hypothetical protein